MKQRVLLYTYEQLHYFKVSEARLSSIGILGIERSIYYVDIFCYEKQYYGTVSVPREARAPFGRKA